MPNTREKLIEVKKALGICYKEGLTGDCKGCTYKGKDSICMDALMEDALAVINHLEEKQATSKWIPVTERLPLPGDYVLCWYEYFRFGSYNRMYRTYGIGYYFRDGFWGGEVSNGQKCKVLAWMPLPQPPKEAPQ